MLKKFISGFLFALIITLPSSVWAQTDSDFNPHFILSDYEMRDYKSMTYSDIERFLERKGNLNQQALIDKNGIVQYATEIIYRAAQDYQINPKVLLATLQKEQSLIEDDNPTAGRLDWAMGYAVCDDCSKDDPAIQKFKGFGKQVDRAAARFDYYFKNPLQFNFQPGKVCEIDDQIVIPANQATANLYIYTPHLHGNENFKKIWDRWWQRLFPDGSLVRIAGDVKNDVYLIQDGLKRKFEQMSALLSRYDINKVVEIQATDLDQYPDGKIIKFSNYSLLSSPKGTVYLLVDDTLRGFASAEVFKKMGYNWAEVEKVSWEDLTDYEEGEPITKDSVYPQGALLQDKTTGGVYYVINGKKQPIWSVELMTANFANRKVVPVAPEELDGYLTIEPVVFKDGELVKSPSEPTVYVISNGEKRPITDEATFNGLGYKWANIIIASEKSLSLHRAGESLAWSGN